MKTYLVRKTSALLLILLITAFAVIPPTYHLEGTSFLRDKKPLVGNMEILWKSSQSIDKIIDSINESILRYYLETLVNEYAGRVVNSEICHDAGEWIFAEFKKMPNLEVRKHRWSARGSIYNPLKYYSGDNIEAELCGYDEDDKVFIFSAHYDVEGEDSPGALDNGAGVAALLTVAKALCEYRFRYTIKFLAFSGEEQGLLGSYAYAEEAYARGEDILGVMNADVIGNNTHETRKHFILKTCSTYPVKWIVSVMNDTSAFYNIGINVEDKIYLGNSDDKAFDDYGYGAMQLFHCAKFMEKFYGRNDTLDLINFSYLTNVTRVLAATLAIVADTPVSPWINIVSPREDSVYLLNRRMDFFDLQKGETFVFGRVKVEVDVTSNDVQKVFFQLLKGDNELEIGEERPVLANFTDSTPPYEWMIKGRYMGLNTVRATVYDMNGDFHCDEIEIWYIPL